MTERLHPNRTLPRATERCHQQGSVLVAVLAVIALLSFLVTRFVDEAVEDLEYRSLFNQGPEVRAYAYSMLELALATVHEVALIDGGQLYAAEQGWGNPLDYTQHTPPKGWSVDIQIQDESTQLPLNTIGEASLNRILEDSFDFDYGTTRKLSSTLADWLDSDDSRRLNGAESDDYLDEEPAYRAANGPLQSLEELRLLKVWQDEFFDASGLPNERFQQLATLFSVAITGPININAAPTELLEVLSENQDWDVDRVFDQLLDRPWFEQLPVFLDSELFATEISLLRVTVKVTRGTVPFTISALVEPNFIKEGKTASASLPGRSSDTSRKNGTQAEQEAIQYPFNILHLTEHESGSAALVPARYSAVDID